MTDLIIAFDDADSKLGIFFNKCATIINESLSGTWNCIPIDSRSLNDIHLEIRTRQFQGAFVFASFTHGSESSLVASGDAFLQSPVERNYLVNSFTYCFACHSGKMLGRELVEKGTHTFIGYSAQVDIVVGYLDVFADCAIEGLLSFNNGATISESLISKKKKYTEQIDELYEEHFLAASVLMDNRDCLVLHGNGNLRNADFTY
jgi:hypothetical protein